jgi:zinc-ribbon domain
MALIDCPECKKQISDTAPACPHCGYKIISDATKPLLPTVALVIGLAAALFFCAYKLLPISNTQQAQKYIASALFDPDSAKFSATFNGKQPNSICGFVNAKNRMGAYTGDTPFIYEKTGTLEDAHLVPEPATDYDFRRYYESIGTDDFIKKFEDIENKCQLPIKWETVCGTSLSYPRHKFCDSLDKDDLVQKLHDEFKID